MGVPYVILHGMGANVTIEVDEQTADVLQTRAAELGVTIPQLIAELAALEGEPLVLETEAVAELDRRWRLAEGTGRTVPQAQAVRWLRTWGTPQFQPWQGR